MSYVNKSLQKGSKWNALVSVDDSDRGLALCLKVRPRAVPHILEKLRLAAEANGAEFPKLSAPPSDPTETWTIVKVVLDYTDVVLSKDEMGWYLGVSISDLMVDTETLSYKRAIKFLQKHKLW